jgi:HK97 family phage major capsid protein
MKKSDQLKQQRAAAIEKQQALVNNARTEKREFSDAENTEFDGFESEIKDLDAAIARELKVEEAMQRSAGAAKPHRAAGEGVEREQGELLRKASLSGFYRAAINKPVEGADAELIAEIKRSVQGGSLTYDGVPVPPEMMLAPEKRSPSTVFGSNTSVPSPQGEFIDALRPVSTIVGAGARVLSGLAGTVVMPRLKNGVAKWEGETSNNTDQSGAGLDGVKLEPKRLTALTSVSKMLEKAGPNLSLENVFRQDLISAQAEAVDAAAIAGASGGNSPVGIINLAGVNPVAIGSAGGAMTYAKALEMFRKQTEANAMRPGIQAITSPRSYYGMMDIKKDAGSGKFLVDDEGRFIGVPIQPSVHMPIDLVKGGSGTVCSAIIVGWFPGLYVAQFGMFDLVVDPYTSATAGQNRVILNGYWDIKAAHDSFFTVIKDITT